MPQTDVPTLGTTSIIWENGSNTEISLLSASSKVRRVVSDKDTIMASDINDLRHCIEAFMLHTHPYTDNVGGGGGC